MARDWGREAVLIALIALLIASTLSIWSLNLTSADISTKEFLTLTVVLLVMFIYFERIKQYPETQPSL